VIERIAARVGVPLSVDTSKPEVMRAAVEAGAQMINDVRALALPGALEAAAASGAAVCLMHMQGQPRTMQEQPAYADVVTEVAASLAERVRACVAAGLGEDRIIVDPGFGFGKTLDHNLELLRHLDEFAVLGQPLLVGLSRKSMIGRALGLPLEERLHASVALALLAVQRGARIVRVHDVAQTRQFILVQQAVRIHRAARLRGRA